LLSGRQGRLLNEENRQELNLRRANINTDSNISPDWIGSTRNDRKIAKRLLALEGKPRAIKYFARNCDNLSNYWYWFLLGTLWISYTGHSDLRLWKRLLQSPRPNRDTSLMKPDEIGYLVNSPSNFVVFRAHRTKESDWISYTRDEKVSARFAQERNVDCIRSYHVKKEDVLAYFSRRGEREIVVLDKSKTNFIKNISLKQIIA